MHRYIRAFQEQTDFLHVFKALVKITGTQRTGVAIKALQLEVNSHFNKIL